MWAWTASCVRPPITTDQHSVCSVFTLICSASIDCAVSVQALKINEFLGLKFCEEAVIRNSSASAATTNCSVSTAGLTWVHPCTAHALVVTFSPLRPPDLMFNIFTIARTVTDDLVPLLTSWGSCCFRCTGEQYLDYLGIEYTTWGLWENHVALTVMTFIFLIIAYLKLRYIKKFT